jgi:hypothetical protein
MVLTRRAVAGLGFTGGVPFMPINPFMNHTPKAKMARPANPRINVFFMLRSSSPIHALTPHTRYDSTNAL